MVRSGEVTLSIPFDACWELASNGAGEGAPTLLGFSAGVITELVTWGDWEGVVSVVRAAITAEFGSGFTVGVRVGKIWRMMIRLDFSVEAPSSRLQARVANIITPN